jgi:hypothetical protein
MENWPYELVAQIASQLELHTFHSMLLTSKDFNKLLLSEFILGKFANRILRKWSFVEKLIEDPNLSALEKIRIQLQRKNRWFLPGIKI